MKFILLVFVLLGASYALANDVDQLRTKPCEQATTLWRGHQGQIDIKKDPLKVLMKKKKLPNGELSEDMGVLTATIEVYCTLTGEMDTDSSEKYQKAVEKILDDLRTAKAKKSRETDDGLKFKTFTYEGGEEEEEEEGEPKTIPENRFYRFDKTTQKYVFADAPEVVDGLNWRPIDYLFNGVRPKVTVGKWDGTPEEQASKLLLVDGLPQFEAQLRGVDYSPFIPLEYWKEAANVRRVHFETRSFDSGNKGKAMKTMVYFAFGDGYIASNSRTIGVYNISGEQPTKDVDESKDRDENLKGISTQYVVKRMGKNTQGKFVYSVKVRTRLEAEYGFGATTNKFLEIAMGGFDMLFNYRFQELSKELKKQL